MQPECLGSHNVRMIDRVLNAGVSITRAEPKQFSRVLTKMGVANDVAALGEPEWNDRLAVRITLPLEQVVADRTVNVRPY